MNDPAANPSVAMNDVLARVDNLPTLSHVAMRVGELVNDPRAGAREIADAMRQDPSLSAKVLRLVNSSYYAIPGGVTDVIRAISFIGFNTLHQLVLSVSVLRTLRTPSGASFDARGLWLHSLAVGVCSEIVARRIGHRDPGVCFTAGLLHDVGKIALGLTEPERASRAFEAAHRDGLCMVQAERAAGLPSHDRVGSRLARRWRFPAALLVPIEHHHDVDSPQLRGELAPSLLAVVDVVALADALCRRYHLGDGGSPAPEPIDPAALARLGFTALTVDSLYTELMHKLERSKIFLELVDEPRDAA